MLATINNLKSFISDATDNEYWNLILQTAEEYVKRIAQREFEYKEYQDIGETTGTIFLKEYPVDEILSLKINGFEYGLDSIVIDKVKGVIYQVPAGRYEVIYKAGYKVIPSPIIVAVCISAKYLHQLIQTGIATRENIGDYSAEYEKEITERIKSLISFYRRVII